VEVAGHQPVGGAGGAGFRQKQDVVAGHGLVDGGTAFFPVREQFVQGDGVHDRARQCVCAGLRAFFQHNDGDVGAFFCGKLLQADGRGQASRAATDDDHVVFHGLAGAVLVEDV
jgi:hypothetical protein